MVQFLSIIFFSSISSIFVGFFKSYLFCVTLQFAAHCCVRLYTAQYTKQIYKFLLLRRSSLFTDTLRLVVDKELSTFRKGRSALETSITICRLTECNFVEHSNLQLHQCCCNLKFRYERAEFLLQFFRVAAIFCEILNSDRCAAVHIGIYLQLPVCTVLYPRRQVFM